VWPYLSSPVFALVSALGVFLLCVIAGIFVSIENPATRTLDVLWQVQASVLGLAVAVSVFAYQSFGTLRGTRRRLISLTGFPAAVLTGVSLNLLIGAAAITKDEPWAGWLGAAVLGLTGGWLTFLVITFAEAPHIQDQRYGLNLRIRVLKRAVAESLRELLIGRIGREMLEKRITGAGGKVDAWANGGDASAVVQGSETGEVADISLENIADAVARAVKQGQSLTVSVRLGQQIGPGVSLAVSDKPISDDLRRRILDAVIVSPPHQTSLADDLKDLHDEAEDAVGKGSSAEPIGRVLATYMDVLHEYAQGWLAYTDQLAATNLPGPFEAEAPLEAVRLSVRQLFLRSTEAGDRDAAFQVVYFPVAIAIRSIEWSAPGYFQLLSLYPQFYALARRAKVDPEMRAIFAERAWWHPVEALELMLPSVERTLDPAKRSGAAAARNELHRTLLNVFRLAIRAGDAENFREGLRRWRLARR
jgi:hypothetical protein